MQTPTPRGGRRLSLSSEGGGQPVPESLRDEWEPLDRWGEDSDPLDSGEPAGELPEDPSELPTRPASEQGEEEQTLEF